MTHKTRWQFRLPSAVIVGSLALFGLRNIAQAEEPTLESLRSQFKESMSALVRLKLNYLLTSVGNNQTNQFENSLVMDGDRQQCSSSLAGKRMAWDSYDGKYGYSVGWHHERPDFPREIIKTSSPSEFLLSNYTPLSFLGVRLVASDLNLSSLIDDSQARLVKTETHDGNVRCHIDFGEHQDQYQKKWRFTAILAPNRDGLPVSITATLLGNEPAIVQERNVLGSPIYAVDEFQQIHDNTLNRMAWFPMRGSLKFKSSSYQFEVREVVLSPSIENSLFSPTPQPGTKLIDDTIPNRRKVEVFQPELALQAVVDQHATNLAVNPTGKQAVAAPKDWFLVWNRLRWGGAILLVICGAIYAWSSRRTI